MKRTQIYLEEEQDDGLARRAAVEGRTKSDLIREAVDRYLGHTAGSRADRLRRFRAAIDAAAGSAPYLPSGEEYVRELREADLDRDREIEAHWRR